MKIKPRLKFITLEAYNNSHRKEFCNSSGIAAAAL